MALCAKVEENEKGRRPESQDETVWRARTLKALYALRAAMTELGASLATLVIA